jgi:endonuclease/exonuclease/phosphatase (EEP) superfamily protein YafD
MNPIRILAAVTAVEIGAAAAATAAMGLGGLRNGWLDVVNSFAPLILAAGILAGGLAYWSLDGATRAATLCLAAISVGYGLALTGPELVKLLVPKSTVGVQYRVLSANVWRDNPTPDLAVGEILRCEADAVFLQEVNGTLNAELTLLKSKFPYASNCIGSGVQILLKFPIVDQGCDRGSDGDVQPDMVWVRTLASDGRPVVLFTTHFGWPFPPGPQQAQRLRLAAKVHALPMGDMILGGDFNTTPWSFAMKRQDELLAPLTRRTIAWFSWPARLDALRSPWSLAVLPIDHVYSGPNWKSARLSRLRIPGSDHFATEVVLTR